jgi:hypothetical protein
VTQIEQTSLGTALAGEVIELRAADGSQQHGTGVETALTGVRRERQAKFNRGAAADGGLLKAEVVTAEVGDSTKDAHCFSRNLRPNPVTGEHSDI